MEKREATYSRVSTIEQKGDTQKEISIGEPYFDKISGSVPFAERPKAQKLLQDIENKKIDTVYVQAIDRLGRNTLDVLKTIQLFTANGVNLISQREGLQTLTLEGKENPTAKLIINILASVAEMERNNIKERQREGIAIKKAKGGYKGRKEGTTLSNEQLIKKYKKVATLLKNQDKNRLSFREIASATKVSLGTVQRVSKALKLSDWGL
jgi:DNA invertase Pin-like site-specific DNA recombinase